MTKLFKQLIHVLWAIEKDLHVIASNKKADLDSNKVADAIYSTIHGNDEED